MLAALPKKKQIPEFILLAFIVFSTMAVIFLGFAWKIYTEKCHEIESKFEAESVRIERAFTDTINHTAYIMKIILMQISPNYEDLEYINNILSKYRTNPHTANILSWTIFSWANDQHQMVVDAVYGILPNSIDISKRDYLSKTTAYPGHLFLGKPIIGSTSNRIMIPGGMGGVDHDGKYIGTLTIGFDIKYLIEKFQNLMRTSKVSFAIIDDNYEIVLESSRFATDHGKYKDSAKKTMEKLIRKINFEDEDTKNYAKFDFLGSVENYYLYKMPGMPYILYLYHNQAEMQKSFWQAITSRLIEIASIGIVATALIVFIYKRESQLRQQAEEASEIAKAASQAKSEFLAYTAHEIRTPLSYVITAAEIMKTQLFGPISDKYKEYAVNIYQNGAELLEFLDDLLDKSQVEKGNFKINNQIIDVRAIIDKIVSQCQARAKAHNIFLETECDQNLPNLIADPRRIAQIISNLINNSISYSPENTVVKVKVENKQDDLQFTIEDSGFGMKREDIEIALSEYGTIKNQNSSKVKSFGLGLPLVKSLVEAHGAEFIIDSTVNVGTKVIIIFGPTRLYRAMGM